MNLLQRAILVAGAAFLLLASYANAIGEYGVGPADDAWLATVQFLCALALLFVATSSRKKEVEE
ncbi:hypothetical protein Q9Q95_16950 [Sphingomonas sp. DG1-23]|uniref:hypothetical protein n=1 Tax=Sphingomonas sp. DG1-23 TaxID=3068316 RepID=UPI00273D3916|nr:hypothetical protein [Sphingomonas sp. DG1-23]MDP5280619.1 hypothetical protein [Sphingomonas sp. DG1-23]